MNPRNDIALKRLPAPFHKGAVRSYCTKRPFGRFVVSCMTREQHTKRAGWIVEDRATGMRVEKWNSTECVQLIELLMTPALGIDTRFIVLPRPHDNFDQSDCVLYDRNTGRWWKRAMDEHLRASIDLMKQLAPHLPPDYSYTPRFPPPPEEWRDPTSKRDAGRAGRVASDVAYWRRLGGGGV